MEEISEVKNTTKILKNILMPRFRTIRNFNIFNINQVIESHPEDIFLALKIHLAEIQRKL